ncbi:MAG: ATP-binding protein [Candidatus Nezhaarchaeota archaeon]|nr:ATP-binding protein [Candidatus Nezhaarchaeota archaeon]
MKEIVVVSGKGGSGKSIFTASLAYLFHQEGFKVMAVDVDVDTPTLHFMLPIGEIVKCYEVYMSRKAEINHLRCNNCLKCVDVCPYGAIEIVEAACPSVNSLYCEGCGACGIVCPNAAVSMKESKTGCMIFGETKFGFPLFTAKLEIYEHNSGLMVQEIRSRAVDIAKERGVDLLVADGSPGIGSNVIASLAGASYAVVVTEPTPQSFRGGFRVTMIAQQFRIPSGFIINKSMGYPVEEEAERMLSVMNARLIGKIPYDYEVVKALTSLKPPVAHNPESRASKAIKLAYENIKIGAGLR